MQGVRPMTNNMIQHRPRGHFAYITGENKAELMVQVDKNCCNTIHLIYYDQYLIFNRNAKAKEVLMPKIASSHSHDFYRLEVSPPRNRMGYYFKIEDIKGDTYFYNEMGIVKNANEKDGKHFMLPYLNIEDAVMVPDWARDAVCYQIFPDTYAHEDKTLENVDVKGYYKQYAFTGGTLKGITSRLSHLKDLGITMVYMTPIFKANTAHRYETVDYYEIDPRLGTKEDLRAFIDTAHSMNIRVVLDAVFNHTSSHFFAFEDILENQENSPYKDWYYINEFPVSREDKILKYETFASVADMPKLNTMNPDTCTYILDIVKYWTKEFNLDGWRLDVANEIPLKFWRKFRDMVKEINEDALIIGESWNDSNCYLQGDTFDSVMNYPVRTALFSLLSDYCTDKGYKDYALTPQTFADLISEQLVRYPRPITEVLLNLVDSHDVPRLRSLFHDESVVELITALLLTLPGTPCIYYGDEIGMGHKDKTDGRLVMEWDKVNKDNPILTYHKQLIKLRHEHDALRYGDLSFIDAGEQVLAFQRTLDHDSFLICANISDYPVDLSSLLVLGSTQLYGVTGNVLEAKSVAIYKK